MRFFCLLLFCSLCFGACSSGESDTTNSTEDVVIPDHLQDVENLTILPADSEPQFEMKLVRETDYGDRNDDVVYVGYINDFAVDDEDRVFLADMSNDKIHVYNPDGTFLQSIGRAGRGPGEFLTTRGGLDIGVNDKYLYVFDDTNYRISRFSLETLELVDIVNVDANNWDNIEEVSGSRPYEFFFRNDDRYLVHFRLADFTDSDRAQGPVPTNHRSQYYLFNRQMEPVSESVLDYERTPSPSIEINGRSTIFSFPFIDRYLTTFTESGYIYHASSKEFFIRMKNPDGSYSRSIYSPLKASRFTDEDLEKLEEKSETTKRGLAATDLPEQWPVLNRIIADDENRLWVSTISDSHEATEWKVLDENSNLLATFPWPRNINRRPGDFQNRYIIKNGAFYHFSTDSLRQGKPTLAKYRIEMNPVGSEQ